MAIEHIWLVCGGRDFSDTRLFLHAMNKLVQERGQPDRIIHGGARGADRFAGNWAAEIEIDCHVYYAKWQRQGHKAGPLRNQRMIDDGKPTLVIAFPGARGTADMVKRATMAGIETIEIAISGQMAIA